MPECRTRYGLFGTHVSSSPVSTTSWSILTIKASKILHHASSSGQILLPSEWPTRWRNTTREPRLRVTQDNSRQKLLRWLAALWGRVFRDECHREKNEARTYEILQVLREGKEHYIRHNFHIIDEAVTITPPVTVTELRAQIVEACSSSIIMAGNPSRRPSTGPSSGKNA